MSYLTEDEAKGKWCPQAREGIRGSVSNKADREWKGASFNRFTLLDNDEADMSLPEVWPKCIGSACMMWRNELVFDPNDDNPLFTRRIKSGRGYCGLAGKPE